MNLPDAWAILTGTKLKEAKRHFDRAQQGLMTKLDKLEGEERALEGLRTLGREMGRGNGKSNGS